MEKLPRYNEKTWLKLADAGLFTVRGASDWKKKMNGTEFYTYEAMIKNCPRRYTVMGGHGKSRLISVGDLAVETGHSVEEVIVALRGWQRTKQYRTLMLTEAEASKTAARLRTKETNEDVHN